MKYLLTVLFLLLAASRTYAQPVRYTGKIAGQYEVELEMDSRDEVHYTGRYHYLDKTQWLTLKGEVTGETQSALLMRAYDADGKQTGSFNLTFDGDHLMGIWQPSGSGKPLGVSLYVREEETEAQPGVSGPDGYYYVAENELKVRTVDEKTLEVAVWISNNRTCTGILLKGKLSASPKGWTAVLPDEYEHGNAEVTIRFEGDNAHILIVPKFAPGADCYLSASPYVRAHKKEDSELD